MFNYYLLHVLLFLFKSDFFMSIVVCVSIIVYVKEYSRVCVKG